jgi:hypothetical protein
MTGNSSLPGSVVAIGGESSSVSAITIASASPTKASHSDRSFCTASTVMSADDHDPSVAVPVAVESLVVAEGADNDSQPQSSSASASASEAAAGPANEAVDDLPEHDDPDPVREGDAPEEDADHADPEHSSSSSSSSSPKSNAPADQLEMDESMRDHSRKWDPPQRERSMSNVSDGSTKSLGRRNSAKTASPHLSLARADRSALKKDPPATGATTASQSNGNSKERGNANSRSKKAGVRFHEVIIREYEMILGDHPNCSYGPPVMIDWVYDEYEGIDLDEYEMNRDPRRSLRQMMMNYYHRRNLLMHCNGYTKEQLKHASNEVERIKRHRKVTEYFLPVRKLEEVVQSAGRKVRRATTQSPSRSRPNYSQNRTGTSTSPRRERPSRSTSATPHRRGTSPRPSRSTSASPHRRRPSYSGSNPSPTRHRQTSPSPSRQKATI